MLAAASIAFLGLAQQADAGVTWLASDTPGGLVLTTTGSIDTTKIPSRYNSEDQSTPISGVWVDNSTIVFSSTASAWVLNDAGFASGSDCWVAGTVFDSAPVTKGFGFSTTAIGWEKSYGERPVDLTPDSTMRYSGLTIATAFGSNLDAGPVLLWTSGTAAAPGSETISVALAAVPEPSSSALLALGVIGLVARRKR